MSDRHILPTVNAAHYAQIEDRFAELLNAPGLLLLQGEAIVPLEAVARSIGRAGARALNIVTGPYGEGFGQWLDQQSTEVVNLTVPFNRAVSTQEVREALDSSEPFDFVCVVHAEAATGVVNDLEAIARLSHDYGALTVVDAVASVGAEHIDFKGWGLDVTVVSAQKALGGPAGVTGLAVSDAAWTTIAENPQAPHDSVLSLFDWRSNWIESGRTVLPTIPNHLETLALETSISQVAAEGLTEVIARHRAARDACRRGARSLGLTPWVESDRQAAAVATTIATPDGVTVDQLVEAARGAVEEELFALLTPAPGPLSKSAIRVGHTGLRATIADVHLAILAIGRGLASLGISCDLETALSHVLSEETRLSD